MTRIPGMVPFVFRDVRQVKCENPYFLKIESISQNHNYNTCSIGDILKMILIILRFIEVKKSENPHHFLTQYFTYFYPDIFIICKRKHVACLNQLQHAVMISEVVCVALRDSRPLAWLA